MSSPQEARQRLVWWQIDAGEKKRKGAKGSSIVIASDHVYVQMLFFLPWEVDDLVQTLRIV